MKTKLLAIPTILVFGCLHWAMATELPTFAISPGDVTKASIEMDNANTANLKLIFTPDKSVALAKFTLEHIGTQVRFVVNGQILSEPRVNSQIKLSMEFPVSSPEKAMEIAKAILNKITN